VSGIQAARVAAALGRDGRFDVELVEGSYGELTVLANNEEIIRSGPLGFVGVLPSVRTVRDRIEQKLLAAQAEPPPHPGIQ
jgi:hypothetical protein